MENELNIRDILPPKKDAPEKFITANDVVPRFLVEASYSPDETLEETIQKDWDRLVKGLSDFVLAEQLTERELQGMGKPLSENYSAYFHETLNDVRKNRKKAEQRLFKLIPRHSQLDACEFFYTIQEQTEKEQEAKERAMELYPPTGTKGMKKEATGPSELPAPGPTNQEDAPCSKCGETVPAKQGFLFENSLFCMKCHDAGHSMPAKPVSPPPPAPGTLPPTMPPMAKEASCEEHGAPIIVEISNVEVKDEGEIAITPCSGDVTEEEAGMKKEASAKWKPGQDLSAKHNGAEACVLYVNEDNKTYIVKVCGTMYPSYYSWEDAHNTFDAVKLEDTKDSPWAKSRGLS